MPAVFDIQPVNLLKTLIETVVLRAKDIESLGFLTRAISNEP